MAAMVVMIASIVCCSKDNNNGNGSDNGGGNVPVGWVDLGLPSGILWAECNVGADVPKEYGDYFAWGETQQKSVYEMSTCRYLVDSMVAKYCCNSDYGLRHIADYLSILEPGDDAATTNMGKNARTPTDEEWQVLIDNTTSEWTTQNGVYGRRFTAANGNSFFLPAAGFREGLDLYDAGSYCCYWTSSLDWDYPLGADYYFGSDCHNMLSNSSRFYGLSVRAVRDR